MRDEVTYRRVIDRLVGACQEGQGQIGARRARAGVWNPSANSSDGPLGDQWRINKFLAGLTVDQREVLAEMLAEEFTGGVHETLVALHEEQIPPFDDGHEGDPYHDFVGRLAGWAWPLR